MTKKTKKDHPASSRRFIPDDIVWAIEGVEKAGLEVHSVEVTVTGSILITTSTASRRPLNNANSKDEALAAKVFIEK